MKELDDIAKMLWKYDMVGFGTMEPWRKHVAYRGRDDFTKIYLEPVVLAALDRFRSRMMPPGSPGDEVP